MTNQEQPWWTSLVPQTVEPLILTVGDEKISIYSLCEKIANEATRRAELDTREKTLETAMRCVKIAFRQMLEENGMFGIKPTSYWINAIWEKDFQPKIHAYFFGNKR